MPTNEILPFGNAGGANVLTQAAYATLAARSAGFSSGIAKSAELNKVWRQASMIAAAVAQLIVNRTGQDVLDDGDLTGLITKMGSALLGGAGAVANSNLANMPAGTVKANLGGGSAAPGDVTLAALIAAFAAATTSTAGPVQLATTAEAQAGTNASHAITPATLFATFSASLATNGYYKTPSGLILQWGTRSTALTTETSVAITFPTTFPAAAYGIFATPINTADTPSGNTVMQMVSLSTSGATLKPNGYDSAPPDMGGGFCWFALGK